MNFLYHVMRPNMEGTTLYPLNQLKDIHPKAYQEAVKKYEGRERLFSVKIPTLDCLWNDVLHLTTVNPEEIVSALRKAGLPDSRKLNWFKISPHDLNPALTTVYLYKDLPLPERYLPGNFAPFDPEDLKKYSNLPQETIEYYKSEYAQGRKPFTFHMIPHILHKGPIDVSKSEVIKT